MMKIHEFHELRQPAQGLFVEPDEIGAHPLELMGANGEVDLGAHIAGYLDSIGATGTRIVPLFPDSDCSAFVENTDLQRNGLFDPFDCVTASHLSGADISEKAQWNELPKQSRRFTALDSGTIPNRGNSNANVQKSIKNTGMVAEADCPTLTPTMTLDQFFSKLGVETYKKEDFKRKYNFFAIPLPTYDGRTANRSVLWQGLSYGAIVFSVNGNYIPDKNGWLIRPDDNDSHDVLLVKMSKDATSFDLFADSENPGGFTKFSPTYTYHYPYLIYVTKKIMPTFKLNGGPALVALGADGFYRPFDNGTDYHKIIGAYSNAGQIQTTDPNAANYVDPAKVLLKETISITIKSGDITPTVSVPAPMPEHIDFFKAISDLLNNLLKK